LRFNILRGNPFARSEVRSPRAEVKLRFNILGGNPFARNDVRSSKTEVKLQFQLVPRDPFAGNEVRSPKTDVKLRFSFAFVQAQRFRTKWCSIVKNWGLIAISKRPAQLFRFRV
jgi:hypothetical protein